MDTITKTNLFKKTEKVLFLYPKLKRIAENKEKYMEIELHERSKSIVRAGQNIVHKERDEIMSEIKEERDERYAKLLHDIAWIESALSAHEHEKGYVVIRMYYFREDAKGNQLTGEEKNTFEDIANALYYDMRTIRRWRNRIVNSIGMCLFGVDNDFLELDT